LPQMLISRLASTPSREAFRQRVGNEWKSLTWEETGKRVRAIAGGLRALGVADETRAAILAGTRVEWILADLGILCAGGATTTIYPSSLAEDCAYILSDSASRVVFAENADQVKKLKSVRAEIPKVEKVIVLDGEGDGDW